jgi:hypothetical protein
MVMIVLLDLRTFSWACETERVLQASRFRVFEVFFERVAEVFHERVGQSLFLWSSSPGNVKKML